MDFYTTDVHWHHHNKNNSLEHQFTLFSSNAIKCHTWLLYVIIADKKRTSSNIYLVAINLYAVIVKVTNI